MDEEDEKMVKAAIKDFEESGGSMIIIGVADEEIEKCSEKSDNVIYLADRIKE